jgi:hypothetical protein
MTAAAQEYTTGVTAQRQNDGSSHFHAMPMRFERRFSAVLQLMANYQWSKLLERRSRLNDLDPLLEKRVAPEDRTHRLVVSGPYDLSFGRGKSFLAGSSGIVNQIVGGWNVNGLSRCSRALHSAGQCHFVWGAAQREWP